MSSFQYYPTGVYTAFKMACKLERQIKHICDPSAGKGHLLRHLNSGFEGIPAEFFKDHFACPSRTDRWADEIARNRWSLRDTEKSVVEIDFSHHADLRELNCKIVGHDFMQVQSLATVSTVIMNPPFANGTEHVLHAWDIVYDAELVAIINAESIKNPNSKEKRRLVDLIEKYGSVEFLQDEFIDHVERTTSVEIALIHLDKKPEGLEKLTTFTSELKTGDNLGSVEQISPEICQALAIPANFIENTYHLFEAAVAAARVSAEAEALAAKAQSSLGLSLQEMQAKGVGNNFREICGDVRAAAQASFSKQYVKLKRAAWAQIIRSTALTDKLSNQARKKVESQAESIYELEFSIANVHGFIRGIIESFGDIYNNMICDLFDNIMNRSTENVVFYKAWKSNAKHKGLGMRIKRTRFILPRFATYSGGTLQYESSQYLSDIDKVMSYLDGKTSTKNGLVDAFKNHYSGDSTRISSEYFEFRFYQNAGTIHFYPKNMEVIERFNRFVGKVRQWIPSEWENANADFKKQYDQGEKLQDQYFKEYSKHNISRYASLVYAMLSERDTSDRDKEVTTFCDSVVQVQQNLGIYAGPALANETKGQLLLDVA